MRHILGATVILLLLALATPAARADTSDAFALQPAANVTLYRGEKIELTLIDKHTGRAVDPTKITWEIDGQPATKLASGQGSFTPATTPAGPSAVYRTPLKAPAHNTLALTATVADPAGPATVKGSITITADANWFALDGDTGIGPQAIGIDLDAGKSGARLWQLGGETTYVINVKGTRKGTFGDIVLELALGPHTTPGTYAWSSKPDRIGLDILLARERRMYASADLGVRDFSSTEGSTTILKTRPVDPPGEVKGFFSGRLCWGDTHNHFFPHYLTVRGHFAVHGLPPSTAPAP